MSTSRAPALAKLDAAPRREDDAEDIETAVGRVTICSEDFGLPSDGLWDQPNAYEYRWCYEHGEFEYLLRTADRWMSPVDFGNPNSEAFLESLLQNHKDSPKFEPRDRKCQAECNTNLVKHVHSVIDRQCSLGQPLYLIQWKVCWTLRTNIEDISWVADCLKANSDSTRRRSARVEAGRPQMIKKYEAIMQVVDIEKLL